MAWVVLRHFVEEVAFQFLKTQENNLYRNSLIRHSPLNNCCFFATANRVLYSGQDDQVRVYSEFWVHLRMSYTIFRSLWLSSRFFTSGIDLSTYFLQWVVCIYNSKIRKNVQKHFLLGAYFLDTFLLGCIIFWNKIFLKNDIKNPIQENIFFKKRNPNLYQELFSPRGSSQSLSLW